jgi:hypothetical protein
MYALLTGSEAAFIKNISITGQTILGIALGLSVSSVIWGIISFIIHKLAEAKKKKAL